MLIEILIGRDKMALKILTGIIVVAIVVTIWRIGLEKREG